MALPGYPVNSDTEAAGYTRPRHVLAGYLTVGALVIAGLIGAFVFTGPFAQFMLSGIQVFPFALLALLAYLGVRRTWAQVLAYIWLGLVLLGVGGSAILLVLSARLLVAGALEEAADPAMVIAALTSPEVGATALWVIFGLIVAGLMLLPPVRRLAARVLPIDPRSSVHAMALSVVVGSTIIAFGQLAATAGSPPMLDMVKNAPDAVQESSDVEQLLLIVYGFVWTVPAALIAGGYATVRTLRGTLERLGLVRPTLQQVAGGIVLAVVMAGGAMLLDTGISRVWELFGWPQTDTAAFEKLLGAAISPIGAVLIGVTAGVGEEMVVRGVLQPRLGILLSNLFFAGLHAFQYGFDGVLSVFIIGLILGIVRARSNTTTSAIVHGVYDFVLVMISALGLFE